jgi:hypothetical protein
MLCCYGLRGWRVTISEREALKIQSRSHMIVIVTFSLSKGPSLSKKAQFVLRRFTSWLMQVGTIECFYESGGQVRSLDRIRTDPFHRQKMTDARRRGRGTLPTTT